MSKRPRHTLRIPLSCERLEDRLPLAGNITATLSGNTLKITGDAEANELTIQGDTLDATKFTLSSNSGTVSNAGPFTGVKNLTINMLGGDDEVTFSNGVTPIVVQGNVTIDGGDGANRVNATELTVQKNLSITNKINLTGTDRSVLTNTIVSGSLTIKNGNGNTYTYIHGDNGTSTIEGRLTITNGTGEDEVYIARTNIGKDVSVTNGDGGSDTEIYQNDGSTANIGGNLTIKNGAGFDHVVIEDTIFAKNVSITNGDGGSETLIENEQTGATSKIEGNLTITNRAGEDEINVLSTSIGKNASVSNGDGGSDTEFSQNSNLAVSKIDGNLTIKNGMGEDYTYVLDTNIGKNVSVTNGKGSEGGVAGETEFYNNEITDQRSMIGGNVTVSYTDGNGSGGEQDGIWDYEILGNVTFNHGKGNFRTDFDGYSVNQPTVILGNLTINGTGEQTVVIGEVYFQKGLSVGKNFTLNAGAGADHVTLDKLDVTGAATFNLKDGANSLTVLTGGDTTAQKSLTINGGKDGDTVQFNARVNTPKLTVNLKDGSDVFNSVVGIFGDAAGGLRSAISVDLGKGDDTTNIDTVFASTATVKLGDGLNTLVVNNPDIVKANVTGGKGVDTVTASNGNIDNLIVKLLADNDFLTALNVDISTSLDIDGGAGNADTLNQTGGSIPLNLAKIKNKNFEL